MVECHDVIIPIKLMYLGNYKWLKTHQRERDTIGIM